MIFQRRMGAADADNNNTNNTYQRTLEAAPASNGSQQTEPLLLADGDGNGDDEEEHAARQEQANNNNNSSGSVDDVDSWQRAMIIRVQQKANIVAHILALSMILVVYWWISKLGGLSSSWKQQGKAKLVFNWHPLLMITCFAFMTVASLAFRFPYKATDRNTTKLVHGTCWLVAMLSALLGLIAVFKSHNDPTSGYIANMYSLHSWIGAIVIALYLMQFLVGVRAFAVQGGGNGSSSSSPSSSLWSQAWFRKVVLKFHVVVGPLIYYLTAATILLGIQEKEGFVGCAYKVDAADLFPIQHIGRIPTPCLVSHTLGILVFLTTCATGIALANFR